MRLFIAGQKAFGASVYELARELGHDVAGVSAPALRRCGELPDRLRQAAERDGVPWMETGRLRAALLPANVDLIVAAHSHDFIGRATRNKARLGAVGYHPSLLPRHRGRDAIRWTLHMGDRIAGGSVYWLSERVDGGDLAAQDFVHVAPDETPASLWRDKLAPLGLKLMGAVLDDLSRGIVRRQPQDEAFATWEPAFGRAPLDRPELLMLAGPLAGPAVTPLAARAR